MNRISQFFRSLIDFFEHLFCHQQVPIPAVASVEVPKESYSGPMIYRSGSRKRVAKFGYDQERRVGFGTFTRLKPIGGHRVRHLSREFKQAFLKEYGVRLK